MSDLKADFDDLSGQLLVSHPSLLDPNFRHTVVLISAHTDDDGALGVIINRPLGVTLGEKNDDFTFGPLSDVPIYEGGPVQTDQVILAAWRWDEDGRVFRLHFGLSEEAARKLKLADDNAEIRAFLGYSGWSQGQMEHELEQNAWLVSPVTDTLLADEHGEDLWKSYLHRLQPELGFLADAPDDPSLN
ncbi:YqgE/AlgH family protein [Cerasicoccus maritimus]|uniref:YqgE/AlgH family protein n=1 Tax=Cerasicoccus maritimus TaxID=490089 RepID=UPI0028524F64|nr:YqgE/AlgH family protein [Cerasicoccus maritimus]